MMMMMIGETHRSKPTVEVPDYYLDDPTANIHSPFSVSPNGDKACSPFDALSALHRYLPSNVNVEDCDFPVDEFSCDHFRMYEFKVRRCARARSHDWTECPYAHPGEKARRRDPRKVHYSGTACPDFRKGQCVRGDGCEYAHGVFECWLHPARYRTQPCKDGTLCRRKVCFFAHTPDQLRLLPPSSPKSLLTESYDGSIGRLGIDSAGSPRRLGCDSVCLGKSAFGASPTSTLYSPPSSPPTDSPPMSPCGSLGFNSLGELAGSMRNMQIGKVNRMSMSPPSWGCVQMGSGFGSPRVSSTLRPGFMSLPATPTRISTRSGLGVFDLWDQPCEEEPVMERVESGRDLRAKIYAKLSKENFLSKENSLVRVDETGSGPDVGWVSELVK